MTTIKVDITKEILKDTAHCKDNMGFTCAIAKAINDLLPNSWVEQKSIIVFENRHQYLSQCGGYGVDYRIPSQMRSLGSIPLPKEATEFIIKFDKRSPWRRKLMKPFSFEITIPDTILDFISKGNMEVVTEILGQSGTMSLSRQWSLAGDIR
jgi:hypothetical protein